MSEFVTVESLRMEIPDLTFPFDARGGVGRFRNTRCQMRQMRLSLSESGLDAALTRAVESVKGFEELRVRFVDGAAHVVTRVRALGSDTFLTFKVCAVEPEPSKGDLVHLFFYDVRAYGPLPYPGRLLVSELVGRLLASPQLSPSGAGAAFAVKVDGDVVALRPIKQALLHLFPTRGWKMPSLSGMRFEAIGIQPGSFSVSVTGEGQPWERGEDPLASVAATRAGAQALAAYEARDLLKDADAALFEGQITGALGVLRGLRERYGLHPQIADGLLDALVASPGPGHVAEAQTIVDELLRSDPNHLRGHLAAPTLALLRGDQLGAVKAYDALGDVLRARGENTDLIACLLATGMVQRRMDGQAAIRLMREVTRLSPRNKVALELLRDLYAETDDVEGRVDVLRQLAGIYTDREALLEVYLGLAELLMERRHDLAEARLYLEKALRLDPTRLQALFTLGESYVLDGQPLRAIRAFGSVARGAGERGDVGLAARLHIKVAELWRGLEDFDSALLECRRALAIEPHHRKGLELAVTLARDHGSVDEVLALLDVLVPLVERDVEQSGAGETRAAAAAEARRVHIFAAEVAHSRRRADTAAAHHRQALAYRRMRDAAVETDIEAALDPSVEFLDSYYRQMGKPEDLIELYQEELDASALNDAQRVGYHRTLATIFDQVLSLGSEASEHLRKALEIAPDDELALAAAVELLTRRQRAFELRDMLVALLPQAVSRRARARVLLELGRIHMEAIPDVAEAARRLREAQGFAPADPDIARTLMDAELALLEEGVPTEESARLAMRAVERWAEVADDDTARHDAFLSAGDLALERLRRPEEALGYYRRAQAARETPLVAERLERVNDALGLNRPQPSARFEREAPADLLDDPFDSASLVEETLGFLEEDGEPTSARPRPQLPPQRPTAHSAPPASPSTRPGAQDPTGDDEVSNLALFRQRLQQTSQARKPLGDSLSVLNKLTRAGNGPDETTEGVVDPVARRNAILVRLAEVRESGDVIKLRDQLATHLLDPDLDLELAAQFHRELGMLYYYDLEDPGTAESHLTDGRRLDPDGVGADFDVLTALEGIYEDLDNPEGLVEVYTEKLEQTTDVDMSVVYGLLKAEMLWERLEQAEAATVALHEVLAIKRNNEPAMRMLADIAWASGNIEGALGTLRQIVEREPKASFERLEGLRELGRRLGELTASAEMEEAAPYLEEAAETYKALMEESPGESDAMVQLRAVYTRLGRHDDVRALLGVEMGLLLGKPDAFPAGVTLDFDPGSVAATLAAPTSQILTDAASLEYDAGDLELAVGLLGRAYAVWPENIGALELRLGMIRTVLQEPDLADDVRVAWTSALIESLVDMTAVLLSSEARFDALFEAGELMLTVLADEEGAAGLLEEALAVANLMLEEDAAPRIAAVEALRGPAPEPAEGQPPELDPDPEPGPKDPHSPESGPEPEPEPEPDPEPEPVEVVRNEAETALAQAPESRDTVSVESRPAPNASAGAGLRRRAPLVVPMARRSPKRLTRPEPDPDPKDGPLSFLEPEEEEEDDDGPIDLLGGGEDGGPPSLFGERRSGSYAIQDDDWGDSLEAAAAAFQSGNTGSSRSSDQAVDGAEETDAEASLLSEASAGWMLDSMTDFETIVEDSTSSFEALLGKIDRAEEDGDRARLLAVLRAAIDEAEASSSVRVTQKRFVLVRRAEVLLGLRSTPAEPGAAEAEEALKHADEALAVEGVDEPEAYFARAKALIVLERFDEAVETLEALARAVIEWEAQLGLEPDDDDADDEIEERIVTVALELGAERAEQLLGISNRLDAVVARLK